MLKIVCLPSFLVLRIHKIDDAATRTETATIDASTGTTTFFSFVHEVERQRSGFPSTLQPTKRQ